MRCLACDRFSDCQCFVAIKAEPVSHSGRPKRQDWCSINFDGIHTSQHSGDDGFVQSSPTV